MQYTQMDSDPTEEIRPWPLPTPNTLSQRSCLKGYGISHLFCLLRLPTETLKHPVMCQIISKITWIDSELSFALVKAQGKHRAVVSPLSH